MKNFLIVAIVLSIFSCCCVLAAKRNNNIAYFMESGIYSPPNSTIFQKPANSFIYGTNQTYAPYSTYDINDFGYKTIMSRTIGADIIEIVMDYSSSMYPWISAAREKMNEIINLLPSTPQIGLRVFGFEDKDFPAKNAEEAYLNACAATKQVTKIQPANSAAMLDGMGSIYELGEATPLVYALDRTVHEDFAKFDKTTSKKIILITDGGENCGGDPCEFAKKLINERSDIHVDVILVTSSSTNFSCLASTTGGKFFNITHPSEFIQVILDSMTTHPNVIPEDYKPEMPPEQHYEFVKDKDDVY